MEMENLNTQKLDNFQNPTMFWQPLGTYCLNMATFEKKKKKSSKCGHLGLFF
jgi:hypothetical protein